MKTILLLIVGFISVAQAELFVGEVNTPLSFPVTTAGYYKIELEGNIIFDVIYGGGDWEINLQTVVDGDTVLIPFIHKTETSSSMSKTNIKSFSAGQHTISATITVAGNHPERASANRSTWKYTVKSAEEIDYRNSLGNLQQSIDQQGTNVANLKNDIATLQAATADQNKDLSDQVANLKNQVDTASQNAAGQSAQQTDAVLSSINMSQQRLNNAANQNTATILSAFTGVSQQVSGVSSQLNTVNNNVTSGNKQNQTLGIIGISLGTAGLGAGVGIPFMMEHRNDGSTDVSGSLDSDKESINYVAPGKGD